MTATTKLVPVVHKLISSSLCSSSVSTYQQPWQLFQNFMQQEMGVSSLNLPVKPDLLILFIAHLYCRGYTSSTVLTYISAIGYVHRLAGLPDRTESHLIKTERLCQACSFYRQPITLPILLQLGNTFHYTLPSLYKIRLFKAMCALAFFAALRVGEITSHANTPPSRILQID